MVNATNTANSPAKKEIGFDNQLIHEASEKNLQLADGNCGACKRSGFPLFLVRQSVVPKTFKQSINWSEGMTDTSDPKKEPDLTTHQYAYRTLREGYVYLFLEPLKASARLDIMAYEVTHAGAFRLRPNRRDIKGSRPKELPSSCITSNHHLKAKFITIDNKRYKTAWVAYTPHAWTEQTITYYQDPANRSDRFTQVDLTAATPEEMASVKKQSFALKDFIEKKRHLLELECSDLEVCDFIVEKAQPSPLPAATNNSEIPGLAAVMASIKKGIFQTLDETYSSITRKAENVIFGLFNDQFFTASHFTPLSSSTQPSEFQQTMKFYQENGVDNLAAIVIDDYLGIAEELSIQRRQLLSPVVDGLAQGGTDRVLAVQQNLSQQLNKGAGKLDIIGDEAKKAVSVNSTITKAMFSENILDLDINRRYKDITKLNRYAFTSATSPLQIIATNTYAYLSSNKRGDEISRYFEEQTAAGADSPLLYLKPEISYARNQFNNIEDYKEIIRDGVISKESSEGIFFLFYREELNENQIKASERPYRGRDKSQSNLDNNERGDNSLDRIHIGFVVGDSTFFELNNLNYPRNVLGTGSYYRLDYCRFMSEWSIDGKRGLGPYRELPLRPEQQQKIIQLFESQYQRLYFNRQKNTPPLKVKVVHYPQAKSIVAEQVLTSRWQSKESKRLYDKSLNSYASLEALTYKNLASYIDKISADYLNYMLWLCGNKASGLAPYKISYLTHECEADASDIHLGYLQDLVTILDNDYTGTLYLPKQSTLWSALLCDRDSIYYHLTEGRLPDEQNESYSLWNIAAGNISDKSLTEQVKKLLAGQGHSEIQTEASQQAGSDSWTSAINQLSTAIDNISQFAGIKIRKNVTVGAFFLDQVVSLSLGGIAKAAAHNALVASPLINGHMMAAAGIFTNGVVRQYQFTIKVGALPKFLGRLKHIAPRFINSATGTVTTTAGTEIKVDTQSSKVKVGGGKAVANQTVTFNSIFAFADEQAAADFERSLGIKTKQATAKAIARGEKHLVNVSDKVFDTDDIDSAFGQAKFDRRRALVDNSISCVLSAVTIAQQHLAIGQLKSQLEKVTDQHVQDMLISKMSSAYTQLMLAYGEGMIAAIKIAQTTIFYDKYGSFFKLSDKMSKGISVVGKAANIIDSISELCKSFTALRKGNTDSKKYFIGAALGVALAAAGLAFSIPVVGQIALALCIVFFLTSDYDDGSGWDGMDRWLNNTLFGNLDQYDFIPQPYPITDTGLYLSDQDYYLASRGGSCSCSHKTADWLVPYPDIFLHLDLPDYDRNKSQFEGKVYLNNYWSNKRSNKLSLTVSQGSNKLTITPDRTVPVEWLTLAQSGADKADNELYDYKEEGTEELADEQLNWQTMRQMMQEGASNIPTVSATTDSDTPRIGLFNIVQRLGNIRSNNYQVACEFYYWPQGKTDSKGNELFPYLLSYTYSSSQ